MVLLQLLLQLLRMSAVYPGLEFQENRNVFKPLNTSGRKDTVYLCPQWLNDYMSDFLLGLLCKCWFWRISPNNCTIYWYYLFIFNLKSISASPANPFQHCLLPWKYVWLSLREIQGLLMEADSCRNATAWLDKPAGVERVFSNVTRFLRFSLGVWVWTCQRLSVSLVMRSFEKWGSPWRPPTSYLKLIAYVALCPLRACAHKWRRRMSAWYKMAQMRIKENNNTTNRISGVFQRNRFMRSDQITRSARVHHFHTVTDGCITYSLVHYCNTVPCHWCLSCRDSLFYFGKYGENMWRRSHTFPHVIIG